MTPLHVESAHPPVMEDRLARDLVVLFDQLMPAHLKLVLYLLLLVNCEPCSFFEPGHGDEMRG